MSTETRAVADMMAIFSRCPRLEPVFATHDKVLLTDGHIEVYSSDLQSKKTWRGRVNVQIKGRKGKKQPILSFSLARTDLEAHMGNNGLLLLCVDFAPKRGKGRPLYAALTPYKIREILQDIPNGQQSIAVPLSKLPRLPVKLERIIEVVHVGSRQNPFAHTDPRLFESITHIAISTVDDIDLTVPTHLRHEDSVFAIEATTKDGSRVPIDVALEIVPGEYLEHTKDLRVAAGNAVFERILLQRVAPEQTRVTLDESLSMIIHESLGRQRATLELTYPSGFARRKRALEFIIGVADDRRITFGDFTLALGPDGGQDPDFEEMRQHLAFLRRLQEVFDRFDIDGELIDLDTLDDDDFHRLNVLYGVFIDGASAGNAGGEQGRMLINIGPWAVMLVLVRGQEQDTWKYLDPFDPASPQMLRWSAQSNREVTIPVTAYDIVEAEHLHKVLNLRLDAIDAAYERISLAPTTAEIANQCVRNLIDAADAGGSRRDEFLRGADRLNDWIIRREGELDHHRLNRWQIAWRRGELSNSDRAEIRAMKWESAHAQHAMAVQRQLACALLLADRDDAQFITSRLTDDQRSLMEGWPIWELYRQLVHKAAPGSHDEVELGEPSGTA